MQPQHQQLHLLPLQLLLRQLLLLPQLPQLLSDVPSNPVKTGWPTKNPAMRGFLLVEKIYLSSVASSLSMRSASADCSG